MADVFSKQKRSEVMSRIRSRGNKATELALAARFRRHKITGWRRHLQLKIKNAKLKNVRHRTSASRNKQSKIQNLKSKIFRVRPDFVFPKLKLAVFVDGCFWHGCPRHATKPKNNRVFWQRKLAANRERDRLVNRSLKRAGWQVVRIWECELGREAADWRLPTAV
jgi:DNA mismatch endonuclease (patch repair protein)